ncbi:MAG: HEPN domain-containing protein [Desulfosporosinus sp.]|nr:HEPN domain-containing protein [Desulfosporosinus sp.]
MDDIGSRDLAFYRLQSAWERLIVAEDMFRLGHYRKIIASAQDLRLASDYDDFYLASKQDAEKTIADAREFISVVENFLKAHYSP